MNFAPVVLFVYNRYDSTMKVIKSLAKNLYASQTEIFIYSNAANPSIKKDPKKIGKIRSKLREFKSRFKNMTIIERNKNTGPNDNMIPAIDEIVNQYGRVIVLEDDIVTARSFLAFMNSALDHYKDDKEIFSICGYNPARIESGLPGDTFAYRSFRSWGWATWADRWNTFDYSEDTLSLMDLHDAEMYGIMYYPPMKHEIMYRNPDVYRYLDWKLAAKELATGQYTIYPKQSLCDNIGVGNGASVTNCISDNLDDYLPNKNFSADYARNDFVFSKEKLTPQKNLEYFIDFRQRLFMYKTICHPMIVTSWLYGIMYYGLTLLYSKGLTICYYFRKYNIKRVAIYDWGFAGKVLYDMITKENIEGVYAIDAREFPEENRLKVYSPESAFPAADIIVVTEIRRFVAIQEDLMRKTDIPVVAMDTIVTECKRDLIDLNLPNNVQE